MSKLVDALTKSFGIVGLFSLALFLVEMVLIGFYSNIYAEPLTFEGMPIFFLSFLVCAALSISLKRIGQLIYYHNLNLKD